jgi:branched-subunit amino acid ABC-type transport system permease component
VFISFGNAVLVLRGTGWATDMFFPTTLRPVLLTCMAIYVQSGVTGLASSSWAHMTHYIYYVLVLLGVNSMRVLVHGGCNQGPAAAAAAAGAGAASASASASAAFLSDMQRDPDA